MVQWFGLCISTSGGIGSSPGLGTKILYDVQCGKKKKSSHLKDQTQRNGSLGIKEYDQRRFMGARQGIPTT